MIPNEVLQSSPEVKADQFNIIRMIWREDHVTERMAEGVAIMIFKSKGSSNDTSQYGAIMLLQVTWKVLSSYLLKRVMADVGLPFLNGWADRTINMVDFIVPKKYQGGDKVKLVKLTYVLS